MKLVDFIPYGKQTITEDDIQSVLKVLRSDWLTTGPKVDEFEIVVSEYIGVQYAVTVSSGTAALHAAMYAIGIGAGDEVIVPPMTFAATANAIIFQGGTPIFVDVDPDYYNISPYDNPTGPTSGSYYVLRSGSWGYTADYCRVANRSYYGPGTRFRNIGFRIVLDLN